jgi:tetratricopeptide (TPR) repeat protein
MIGIDPKTWTQVSPLLDDALDLPPAERAVWLDGLHAARPAIATVVAGLLAAHDRVAHSPFLQTPMVAAQEGSAGTTVGAYTLDVPLGKGGMGTVWRARRNDGRYEGAVAVKLLHLSALDAAGAARFQREGTLLARLSHPHIAHLFDAGVRPTGQPYLVLQLVEGHRIDTYVEAAGLDVEACLGLFLQVCDAVAHAHAHLIVHRDIKPSNVLVDASGHATLLDFGIAQLLDRDGGTAVAAPRALTPEFASPEQVRGEALTTATDVYALGVLLYRLLTGHHPTGQGLASSAEHARATVERIPEAASAVAPPGRRRRLTGDLDVILAKALEKSPADRYASVEALASDVRRHLRHEPIAARADSRVYRLRTFARRHRTGVGVAAAVTLALAGAAAALWVQGRQSARDRDFALQQLARAEATIDLNQFLLTDAAPQGRPFTAGDLLTRAETLLNRHPVDPPDAPTVESLISIGTQFQSQDEDGNARRVLSRAYDLSQQLPATHISTRAAAGCALASTLARGDLDDLSRAQTLVDAALQLLPDARPFVLDRVRCERSAATVARHAGRDADDIAHVTTARRLLRESGLGSPLALLDAELAIAAAYRSGGRMTEAEQAYRDGWAQLRALGRDRTEQAGTLLNDWGLALMSLGRPLDADRAFAEAVAISQADATGASVSPMLLLNAARPVLELGREDQAIAMIERSIEEAARLDDQVVQLQALMLLAGAERQRGRLDRAAGLFDRAEAQLRQRLPPGHGAFAALMLQRANIATARGQLALARSLADDALAHAEAISPQDELVSGALLRRAQIGIAEGRGDLAHADAARAVDAEMRRAVPGALSSRLGRMFLTLGEAQRSAGHDAAARSTLETAVRHLEATLGPAHKDSARARQLLAGTR